MVSFGEDREERAKRKHNKVVLQVMIEVKNGCPPILLFSTAINGGDNQPLHCQKKDFENWYRSYQYYSGLNEVVDFVRRRAGEANGRLTVTSGDGDGTT